MWYLVRYFNPHQGYIIFRVHTLEEMRWWETEGWVATIIDKYHAIDELLALKKARKLNIVYRRFD